MEYMAKLNVQRKSDNMVMKSRFCSEFEPHLARAFNPSLKPHQIVNNINFTIDIWQPFIDGGKVSQASNVMRICGPLLGILIEIANLNNSNLTFIVDEANDILPFVPFEEQGVNIDLKPLAFKEFNSSLVKKLIYFSHPLGDAPMASMLSSQIFIDQISLEALATFNDPVVYFYYGFWLVINLLAACISLREYLHENVGTTLFRGILFQSSIKLLDSHKKTSLLLLNFVLMFFFFNQFIANTFLNLFTFGIPSIKIETIEDLLNNPDIKICVFKGEIPALLFTDDGLPLNKFFRPRLLIANPGVDDYGKWETWALNEINKHRMVLFSDKYYIDYMLSMYEQNFASLYRPLTLEKFIYPYVIPLSLLNSKQFNKLVNHRIVQVLESGLYGYWVLETLLMNKRTTKDRMIFYNNFNNFKTKDFINEFQQTYRQLSLADFAIFLQLSLVLYLLSLVILIVEVVHQTYLYRPNSRLIKLFDSFKNDSDNCNVSSSKTSAIQTVQMTHISYFHFTRKSSRINH